ncbi:MAG: class D sortase [Vicinamibacterales bacterium]|nr:class D sortase [Vicinamibacterales bacterium]
MEGPRQRLLLIAERTIWAFGVACLVAWGAFHIWVTTSVQADLERFSVLKAAAPQADTPRADTTRGVALHPDVPDQSLWSAHRLSAWRAALSEPAPAPLGVLRIPKIRLEVAVLPGTDERTLDRAVGHIDGTAQPGTDGNSGIAGHRDGFFRGLKDIAPGDAIELDTLRGDEVYRVEQTWVVGPDEVSVLAPTPTRALTLVTCYPFYFVGSAPQRFIVRAIRVTDRPVALLTFGSWLRSSFGTETERVL